ncbi:MAG: B12-binding domain-containing radical SAM protein [Deltaproteobacteria bacterium]|nr:B12-binding domain-containing radical SAM protein [Deltaproteobacteria bacterium]
MVLPDTKTVVLINPPATYAGEIAQKCYPPAGLLYLAASLRKAGFFPRILETNALGLSAGRVKETLKQARPLAVGLPVFSEVLSQVHELAAAARAAVPETAIILGGPHATAVPGQVLEQFPMADFLLTGEADHTLPALCRSLAAGERPGGVPGLWAKGKGTGLPFELPDTGALPWPAKDLVAEAYRRKRYHTLLVGRRPVDTLFTSRGCPHACGFCYNFRRKYRARKPEDVVAELAGIAASGIRDVEICDDTFTADEGRALAIFDLIIAEKLPVSFRIKSRVDAFSERLAKKASQAGVYLVSFGAESASQRILDAMGKRITPKKTARAIALARAHGIASHTSWIIGYPGETPDTVEETVRFIQKTRPTTANLAVLRPYPATPVYEQARAEGTLMGGWAPGAPMPWVRLPWVRDKKILDDLCASAVRRIYFSPHYTAAFALMAARSANTTLVRYALQEARKVLLPKKPG